MLRVKNLRVHYATPLGDVIAVNGVNLNVYEGETLGLVGESGCGKSTLAMAILRLVQPPGRIVSGQVQLHGIDLVALSEAELRQVRWSQIALIPQGAMNSLNPVMRVKNQIAEAIETHQGKRPPQELKERILRLLAMVGLPGRVYNMYPARVERRHETARMHCNGNCALRHPSSLRTSQPARWTWSSSVSLLRP